MKALVQEEKEVELKTLHVEAGVRYWEDATVNGVEDEDGSLIPCREGDCWCPVIDLDSGVITNWTPGVVADVHYKVCDDGRYVIKDVDGNAVMVRDDYVPDFFPGDHYGDYIIMKIDEQGKIRDWPEDFEVRGFKRAKA